MSRSDPVRPGSVVAWWDGAVLSFAVVADASSDRLRLILERGREERVRSSRILGEVEPPGAVPGSTLEERRSAAERMAAIVAAIAGQADLVEVDVVWEVFAESTSCRLAELAELALSSTSGAACAAVALALQRDGLHFQRRADEWVPRSPEVLAERREEQRRADERQRQRDRLFEALAASARGATFAATGDELERRYIDALREIALHEDQARDASGKLAVEALVAAGVRYDRPHEGAFRLLRATGHFASDDENLQIHRHGLRVEFDEAVLANANRSAARDVGLDRRVDLSGLEAISIDSAHTCEIDDLLSVERDGDRVRLGIHIADPAAYVEPNDPVDREAATRGLTHYMPDVRLPMFPPVISEQAASLTPGQLRPALSFHVTLDAAGEITEFELVRSRVQSAGRLDYAEADRRIRTGQGLFTSMLRELGRIGVLRREARRRAGALTIQTDEVDVHLDEHGRPYLERLAGDSIARHAVTEAMVLVGELAARFCIERELPAIYRRQASSSDRYEPPDGHWDAVAVRRARRGMRRAGIGLKPGPHASLGLAAYVQASSPLRRFQDLAVHRQIAAALSGDPPCYDHDAMQRIASTSERAEVEARRAERAAAAFWILRFLERRTGETVEATVVEVEPRPVVLLTETLWEQPANALRGVEPGQTVRLAIERVNPRAGLVTLRRVDG